jgi:hypothetical protein
VGIERKGDELPNVEPWQVYPFSPLHVASGVTVFGVPVAVAPLVVEALLVAAVLFADDDGGGGGTALPALRYQFPLGSPKHCPTVTLVPKPNACILSSRYPVRL